MRGQGLGCRVQGLGLRVDRVDRDEDPVGVCDESPPPAHAVWGFDVDKCFGFGVSGFGSRIPDFGLRVSGMNHSSISQLLVANIVMSISVWGLGFGVSGPGFRVSGFGSRVPDFGFRVSGTNHSAMS